jgi:fibronectin type 3 domain-containing protein
MSKRSRILLALPFVIALGVMGCGDGNPAAPTGDTVPPAAVLDLDVTISGTVGAPAVSLSWAAGSEVDLAGYNVYRSKDNQAATLVGVETATNFVDTNVVTGSAYRYEVSSVDTSGNESVHVYSATVVLGQRRHTDTTTE